MNDFYYIEENGNLIIFHKEKSNEPLIYIKFNYEKDAFFVEVKGELFETEGNPFELVIALIVKRMYYDQSDTNKFILFGLDWSRVKYYLGNYIKTNRLKRSGNIFTINLDNYQNRVLASKLPHFDIDKIESFKKSNNLISFMKLYKFSDNIHLFKDTGYRWIDFENQLLESLKDNESNYVLMIHYLTKLPYGIIWEKGYEMASKYILSKSNNFYDVYDILELEEHEATRIWLSENPKFLNYFIEKLMRKLRHSYDSGEKDIIEVEILTIFHKKLKKSASLQKMLDKIDYSIINYYFPNRMTKEYYKLNK